ncbi:MAG: ABC transporter permease [Gemmatimonadales bacterium]
MGFLPSLPGITTSLRALATHPLRTALSTLGIVMGVGSLVAVLSVGDGVEKFSREQLSRGTDLHVISLLPRTTRVVDGISFPNRDHPVFTPADAEALRGAVPEITEATVIASGPGMVRRSAADAPRAARVTGRTGGPPRAVSAGRFLTRTEQAGTSPVTVISHNLAEVLGGVDSVLHSTLQVERATLTVVGVLEPSAGRVFVLEVPLGIISLAADSTSRSVLAPELVVVAGRLEDVPVARAGVERWLAGWIPDWQRQVVIEQNQTRLEQASQAMALFKLFMGAIVSISLLVGGIGVMNVLLASVTERTREIGIQRAAGARRRDVLWQFLSESVVVTGLGSGIGLVVGFAGAVGITAIMRARTDAPVAAALAWPTVAIAAGAAIVVGVVFGLYPALRASRLSPIDAIRHE